MLHSVFLKTLRDLRRGFVWWSVGLAGMSALMVSVYPTVRGNAALNKLVQNYPAALKGFFGFGGELDYTSAAGYLGMELFSLMVPLLLLIAAIAAGSGAVAGEEDRGTLDLLLSLPVSRPRLALEKFGALAAESVALGFVVWASLWIGAMAVGMEIRSGEACRRDRGRGRARGRLRGDRPPRRLRDRKARCRDRDHSGSSCRCLSRELTRPPCRPPRGYGGGRPRVRIGAGERVARVRSGSRAPPPPAP